jgi:GTP 3',8-cyclase
MPEEGVKMMNHSDILSFHEIVEVVEEGVKLGIKKVRITGGEPLVRKGIVQLVSMLSKIEGIQDLAMTTNGILLDRFAQELANAGLMRVNISLDSVEPEKYRQITRIGDFEQVKSGIVAARRAGLLPIKINCVVRESHLENDAQLVAEYCRQNNLEIRYIREMDLEKGEFWKVKGGEGGDCKICNRLRLTSNGMVKPCLFSNLEYDVRKIGAKQAIYLALGNKPESGTHSIINKFSRIGG